MLNKHSFGLFSSVQHPVGKNSQLWDTEIGSEVVEVLRVFSVDTITFILFQASRSRSEKKVLKKKIVCTNTFWGKVVVFSFFTLCIKRKIFECICVVERLSPFQNGYRSGPWINSLNWMHGTAQPKRGKKSYFSASQSGPYMKLFQRARIGSKTLTLFVSLFPRVCLPHSQF